jgi:hypothetical protein
MVGKRPRARLGLENARGHGWHGTTRMNGPAAGRQRAPFGAVPDARHLLAKVDWVARERDGSDGAQPCPVGSPGDARGHRDARGLSCNRGPCSTNFLNSRCAPSSWSSTVCGQGILDELLHHSVET